MATSPHLRVSVPHVEKLADLLVLLLPISPLELVILRCYSAADDAALGHDYYRRGTMILASTCASPSEPFFATIGIVVLDSVVVTTIVYS